MIRSIYLSLNNRLRSLGKALLLTSIGLALTGYCSVVSASKTAAKNNILDSFSSMVLVKGGCYQMGDVFGDGESDEQPVHKVCVQDFYLGDHEVTQGEWKQLMGSNPSGFKECGDNCPVEQVSWDDAQQYIKKLNIASGKNYRLPTEAEWEYAARERGKKLRWAGTNSQAKLIHYAWFEQNSQAKTHPVKTKKPNALGLYDMTGNIIEWLSDYWIREYYQVKSQDNPQGPGQGVGRAARGGSWRSDPSFSRVLNRYSDAQDFRSDNHGFRLAHGAAH